MNAPVSRIKRVRHELRRREVKVCRIEQIGSHFVSITFSGDDLVDFKSESFDDHIKFMFEDAAGNLVRRDYTPRHFDPVKRELTIEFALHGSGGACNWAKQATLGKEAIIGGPRGSLIIPMDYEWQLMIGDSTALPAISRRLEELPAGSRVQALLLAEAESDLHEFQTAAHLDVQWFNSDEVLLATLSNLLLPTGEGFAWAAGEASLMKAVRRVLVEEKKHPKEGMRIAAYWRHGAEGFHEELTDSDSRAPRNSENT
ncbi:siderophore-interacting protein [Pseudomonas sp. NY15364]|uniref:siderophore-interacting protein n=1 Tax=Pseudomonas sp. NY15364 TaxID=3400353 RepID=UPI003A842A0C